MTDETQVDGRPSLLTQHGWIPWVAPFAVYMLGTMAESSIGVAIDYRIQYSVKLALVSGLLVIFRQRYPAWSGRGVTLGLLAGTAGIVVWVGLVALQARIPGLNEFIEAYLGGRAGFNPFAEQGVTAASLAFVAVRLTGLIIVVPVMEELFWRGFLARFLIDDDFEQVRPGQFTTASFLIVTLGFVCVHPELLAALTWGAAINWLYARTSNLWACIAMHSTTNALLGVYVLSTGTWSLW